MRCENKHKRQYVLSLMLCIVFLGQTALPVAWANDRSADIIGSRPLLVENLINAAGLSGQGQIVGIADSGLDKGSMTDIHPDLQSQTGQMPKVVMLQSYAEREQADDPIGHGTFMAATIAGTGAASEGKYRGIAPGASLYFQALLDRNNNIRVPANISDLFLPAYSAGVRIHVNGWGNNGNKYSESTAQIDRFTYQYPSFLPIFGAGNNGPGNGTLTTQANSKNALVVGSSQVPRPAFDTQARFADQVAESSSLGPTMDGRIKPDLLVPGSALISACSSLSESNFTANPLYTRMGGTSMAAAVTGGALALLREQLDSQFGIREPSSALLKAILINGARTESTSSYTKGFGILDLAASSLALKEGNFHFIDNRTRIKQGESVEYKVHVNDPAEPVKITLAWVDPPGPAGAPAVLINDLDLYVQDANGQSFYGNDVGGSGSPDRINNVEQVSIRVPNAGDYTIVVKAANIKSENGQDFALVYGQALKTGIIQNVKSRQVELADGNTLDLGLLDVKQVLDGDLDTDIKVIKEGSDVYYNEAKAYIFGNTWETGGIQALSTAQGELILEMNNQVREGGYYVDQRALSQAGSIIVNGSAVADISQIPMGSGLKASINPALQTLWKLEAYTQEISGYISETDTTRNEIRLLNNDQIYKLSPGAAISYRDRLNDCMVQDAPYSTVDKSMLANILPGTSVTMRIFPGTGIVQSLFVQRPLVLGRVAQVNTAANQIMLTSGRSYSLFPGAAVTRNGEPTDIGNLQPGDWIKCQLMIDNSNVIGLQAFSEVSYGRVVYANAGKKSLYLIDSQNRSRSYTISKATEAYGLGTAMDISSLIPGSWVRVISDPTSREAWRIDTADVSQESVKILTGIDYSRRQLNMEDGTEYLYNSTTRISKGGYIMSIDDLIKGDQLQITTLSAPSPWSQVLAGIEVNISTDVEPPDLRIYAQSLNGVLILRGYTNAGRLYVYRKDGSRELIAAPQGNINRILDMLDNETEITAVAMDTVTGAMKDVTINVTPFNVEIQVPIFNDISGHWAERFIMQLAQKNIVKGYEDGTFRPDQTISRAELMVLIAQQQVPSSGPGGRDEPFADDRDIPWWARTQVQTARRTGLINGFPDGTFRPYQAVTRRELAIVFAHLRNTSVVNLFPGESLQPDRLVTRAEVAALLGSL